jgi:fucose permease
VLTSYALFVLVGLAAGVVGVLLLAQIRDYGVDRTAIGYTFFTGSAGFIMAGAMAGPLIHRWGTRSCLLGGGAIFVLTSLYIATRPPFVLFVLVHFTVGYAMGMLESVLNAYLAAHRGATSRLNRLHAFFGVGALLGPPLAAWTLTFTAWPRVPLALAVFCLLLMVAVWVAYPRRAADPLFVLAGAGPASNGRPRTDAGRAALLPAALRQPAVLLGAGLLACYVGLEIGVGNWAYGYLVEARSLPGLVAGYAVSGYWLGLTLGRFVISPVAARIGLTVAQLMYSCLAGIMAAAMLVWLVPASGATAMGFVLLGFLLGPIFPTTMAVTPQLIPPRVVPTAIGVMNAGSAIGGAVLPWLAGVAAEDIGIWTLPPVAVVLALLMLAIWWRLVARIRRWDA